MAIVRNMIINSFTGKFKAITSNICPKTKKEVGYNNCKECTDCAKTIVPTCSSCYIKVWCSFIPQTPGNINTED